MLSGIKVVDRSAVEAALKQEKKVKKKDKKAEKKRMKRQAKASVPFEQGSGSTPSGDAEPELQQVAERPGLQDEHAAVQEPAAPNSARGDWMTTPGGNPLGIPVSAAEDKADLFSKEAREAVGGLQPHPGGKQQDPSTAAAGGAATGVGDAGASWRMKALRRAQAQAAEQGGDVASVLAERWGSVAQFERDSKARAAHPKAHMHAARERRGDGQAQDSGPGAHREDGDGPHKQTGRQHRDGDRQQGDKATYLEAVKSGRSQMRRPAHDSSMSWRSGKQREAGRDEPQHKDAASAHRHTSTAKEASRREPSHAARQQQQQHGGDGITPVGRSHERQETRVRPNQPEAAVQNQHSPSRSPSAAMPQQAQHSAPAAISHPASPDHSPDRQASPSPQPSPKDPAPPREKPLPTGGNFGAAAALKARLLGVKAEPAPPQATSRRESIALPLVDSRGQAMPGAFGRERAGRGLPAGEGRKPKRLQRYGEAGDRERWFADDDKAADVMQLVKQQRHAGGEDIDANLADNIARKKRFKETELDADAEYDVDAGLDLYESRNKRTNQAKVAKRERTAQIADARRLTSALDKCDCCFASARRNKHLTLAIGQYTYLGLPPRGSLSEHHCLIIPSEHVASTRQVDEAVWTELRNFKKCLLQMAMAQDRDIIFMETAKQLGDTRVHAVVEAVPVPRQAFAKAPIYFKKAVDDVSGEWSQHHAKRLIDTRAKGLRGSIPPNFAYFFVEFGLSAGFVHVIDDEEGFDAAFGRNILIGLLHLPQEDMHRRAHQDSSALHQRRALDFAQAFAPYDWTQQLA